MQAPSIGKYKGKLIPAWINAPDRGGRFAFVGIALEGADGSIILAQLGDDEIVVSPGLIYRAAQPQSASAA